MPSRFGITGELMIKAIGPDFAEIIEEEQRRRINEYLADLFFGEKGYRIRRHMMRSRSWGSNYPKRRVAMRADIARRVGSLERQAQERSLRSSGCSEVRERMLEHLSRTAEPGVVATYPSSTQPRWKPCVPSCGDDWGGGGSY